jgi:hypothetical protein
MKRKPFTKEQIIAVLREQKAGNPQLVPTVGQPFEQAPHHLNGERDSPRYRNWSSASHSPCAYRLFARRRRVIHRWDVLPMADIRS